MMESRIISRDETGKKDLEGDNGGSVQKKEKSMKAIPVTSENSLLSAIEVKNKKAPGFCSCLFFCNFNKFFKKKDIEENDLNLLPDAICSENILEKFDEYYQRYEDKEKTEKKEKNSKKSTKEKAKAGRPVKGPAKPSLDDSVITPLDSNNPSNDQISRSKLHLSTFQPFCLPGNITRSMIDINPTSKQRVIKERRISMAIMMNSIYSIIRWKLVSAIVLNILSTMVKITIPLCMKRFLEYYMQNKTFMILLPYGMAASALSLVDGLLIEHSSKNVCGCKAMTGQILRSVFYRKITKATYSFLKVTDSSFINKMLLYEFEHITQMVGEIPKLITSPITLILSMVYIFLELKALVVVVLAVFIICVLLLSLVKRKRVSRLRAYFAKESSKSEKLNECIPNMKDIKLNSLENFFLKNLQKIRDKESKDLMKLHIYDALSDSIFGSTSLFCSIMVIGAMAILGGGLNASEAFSVIVVLELLHDPLDALANSLDKIEAYSSAKRALQLFLEEVPEKTHIIPPGSNFPRGQIIMENCNFDFAQENFMNDLLDKMMGEEWARVKAEKEKKKKLRRMRTFGRERMKRKKTNSLIFSGSFRATMTEDSFRNPSSLENKTQGKFVTLLTGINAVIKPGQKVCLVGVPGSGLSEFLLSIMSEGRLSNNGVMKIKGSISYLNIRMKNFFNGTVRRNIILNSEYDKGRFRHVVRMLNINFNNLEGKEFFRITEGAKNLTTDMQRKILLARWIYEKKDIYLIDDLFDDLNRMEWKIFYQRVFLNDLRNRTVIFMSNTHYQIEIADHIIVFDSGGIKEQGSYKCLLKDPESEVRKIWKRANADEMDGDDGLEKVIEEEEDNVFQRPSILVTGKNSPFNFLNRIKEMQGSEDDEEEKMQDVGGSQSRNSQIFNSMLKESSLIVDESKYKIVINESPVLEEENPGASESEGDSIDEDELQESNVISNIREIPLSTGFLPPLPGPQITTLRIKTNRSQNKEIMTESESVSNNSQLGEENEKKGLEQSSFTEIKLPLNLGLLIPAKRRHRVSGRKSKLNSSLTFTPMDDDARQQELDDILDDKSVRNSAAGQNLDSGDLMFRNQSALDSRSLNYKQAKIYLKKYMLMRGRWPLFFIMVLFLLSSVFMVSYDVWIGFWSVQLFGEQEDKPYFYFIVYLCLSLLGSIYIVFRDVVFDHILYKSSNLVNHMVMQIIMRLKMNWFDNQSVETIIYRLTKDQSQLDTFIPKIVLKLIESSFMVVAGFVILNYIYFGMLIIVSVIYVCVIRAMFKKYLRVVLSMTGLVAQRKAQVISLGGQTLNMCVYLRGTKNLAYLKRKFFDSNDQFQKCTTHVANFSQRWIGIRLTYISASLIFAVFCFPLIALVKRDFFFQEVWKIAFSLTWGFKTNKFLKTFLRSLSLVFISIISISRLYEYVEAKKHIEVRYSNRQAEELESDQSDGMDEFLNESRINFNKRGPLNKVSPAPNLPDLRTIKLSPTHSQVSQSSRNPARIIPLLKELKMNSLKMRDVSMRKKHRGNVLHNITMQIDAQSIVGFYGRGLSGISDLFEIMCGLFDRKREGGSGASDIMISGQSIDKFKLKKWRECFAYLNENPLVVSGKVRDNIDPFQKHTDEQIIRALDLFRFNELIDSDEMESSHSFFEEQRLILHKASMKLDSPRLEEIVEEEDDQASENSLEKKESGFEGGKVFGKLPELRWGGTPQQNIKNFSAGKMTTKQSINKNQSGIKSHHLGLEKNEDKMVKFDDEERPDDISEEILVKDDRQMRKVSFELEDLEENITIEDPKSISDDTEEEKIQEPVNRCSRSNSFPQESMLELGNKSPNLAKNSKRNKNLEDKNLSKSGISNYSFPKIISPEPIKNKSLKIDKSSPLNLMKNNSLFPPIQMDKRRYSAKPRTSLKERQNEPENMNPDKAFSHSNSIGRDGRQQKKRISTFSLRMKDEEPRLGKIDEIPELKSTKEQLKDHFVSPKNRENIEDFLDYKINSKAANLTIGLKKIIMLARIYLDEPNFIVLEENALHFDELDNSFIFNILKKMRSTVIINMSSMNFLLGLDKIFIMEKGKIKERGNPNDLLMDEDSVLYSEVEEVDKSIIEKLKRNISCKSDLRALDVPSVFN